MTLAPRLTSVTALISTSLLVLVTMAPMVAAAVVASMLMSPAVVIVPAAAVVTAEPVRSMSPAILSTASAMVSVVTASRSIAPVVLTGPLRSMVTSCELTLSESSRMFCPTFCRLTRPDWLVICRANGPSTSVPKATAPASLLVTLTSPDRSTFGLPAKVISPVTVMLPLSSAAAPPTPTLPSLSASISRLANGTLSPTVPRTTRPLVATRFKVSVSTSTASRLPLALKTMLPLFEV